MAYAADKKPLELTALTSLAAGDGFVVGDADDATEVAKYITKANLEADLTPAVATTVTTNANLTGHITSIGNAAVLGSFTTAQLNTAISDGSVGTGDVTKVGTPVDNQVGVWTGDGTLEGDANFTFDTAADCVKITGQIDMVHTAVAPEEHGIQMDVDAAGFGDVKALDIDYITGAIAAGEDEGVILVNVNEATSTGGEVFGYEILATDFGATNVYGMKTGVNVNPISQDSGTFANMDSALNKAVDVLAALSSGGAGNISVFVADNDTFTIGDAAKFDEMEFLVDTGASGAGIAPTFEFSTGVGTWTAFTPTDGTNGFKNTGAVLWDQNDLSGWAAGTGSEYLVRITRTKNSLSTAPIIDTIQIAAAQVYSWDNQGVITGNTFEATGDTTAGDNAAMGYTAAEGLVLTGQGSTNDVTIKNDADADVIKVPTGTTNVDIVGALTASNLSGTNTGDQTSIVGITGTKAQFDTAVSDDNILFDSEVTNLAQVKAFDTTDYATAAQGSTADSAVQPASTTTLTNKRITKRVGSTTSSATPTINTDNVDIYKLTAQAADITSFTTNLSGTPTDGQTLIIQITGTAARTITWGSSFEASTVALPTTTVTTARLDVGFIWNTATNKWRCIASA